MQEKKTDFLSLVDKTATFEELGNLWIFNKKQKLKQSTYVKYQYMMEAYINPVIGSFALSDIKTQLLDDAMNKIYWKKEGEHLSYSLTKSIIFVTNAILNYGKRLNLLGNVEITFEISRNKVNSPEVFNHTGTRKIIDYAVSHPSDSSLGVLISLYTGLRIGEVCALQRRDIDFDKNIIYIRKTVQRLKTDKNGKTELIITRPKSEKSYRDIPMPSSLSELLKQYMLLELEDQFFILGKKEIPYEPRTLQYGYQRMLKDCKINYINFHCLRHTFATNCIRSGFDIKTLSEILGHSNVNFTMNKYVHSDMEEKRKQMNLLNNYLN